jgi:hypothetical protein
LPDKGKTLDELDVVQGMAEDKVMGVGRGTHQSPKQAQGTMVNKAELVGTSSSNMQSVGAILLMGSPQA